MNEKEQLMKELQALQFAQVDLGLFLDTHPDSEPALRMQKDLSRKIEQVRNRYEQSYGALIAGESRNGDYWDWVAAPFPWET